MKQDDVLKVALHVGLTFELPPTKLFEFAELVAAYERDKAAERAWKSLASMGAPWKVRDIVTSAINRVEEDDSKI